MTRVLLADDQAVVRAGLRTILETDEAIEVVAEANDGQEAVTLTQALDPDVMMMDIRMPVLDGIKATERLMSMTLPMVPPASGYDRSDRRARPESSVAGTIPI
jgi:YesN/AraC family two-component response regulator